MPSYQTVEGISLNNAEGTVWSVPPYLSKYSHTFTKLGGGKKQPTNNMLVHCYVYSHFTIKETTQFIY